MLEKINPYYNLLIILLVGLIFFFLGYISALEQRHNPIEIKYTNPSQSATLIQGSIPRAYLGMGEGVESGEVIGSKSGKKYYFPWCGTVKRIKPENQVHFSSIEEAKKAGFTAGGNCKGLD